MKFKLFGWCVSIEYTKAFNRVPKHNAEQEWVGASGKVTKVCDLSESYMRNIIGLMLRQLKENRVAYIPEGYKRVVFAEIMRTLNDNGNTFVNKENVRIDTFVPMETWTYDHAQAGYRIEYPPR